MTRTPPRRWNSLLLTAASITLAAPAMAQINHAAAPKIAPPSVDAQLWLAQAEGGEGGEAGAVAGAAPDLAYLAQLAIVEGHLLAAQDLYAKGQADEAVGLSYHPEAEMMDEVREKLAQAGAGDITPAMVAFSARLEAGAPLADVQAALNDVRSAIAAAESAINPNPRLRMDAVVLLLRAAAAEYAGSIEAGAVSDVMAYHESHAFVATAGVRLTALAQEPSAKSAAEKTLAALPSADAAFGDMQMGALVAGDAAILAALAARAELYASAVR